jgi:DNA polymerase type B, organellar and viral
LSNSKQNKKSEKPAKLFTLDVETRGKLGEVFLAGLFDGTNFLHSNNSNTILTHLQEQAQHYDVHVFTHFLDFDLSKMLQDLFTLEKIDYDKCIFVKNRVVKFKSENMTFHCSYKLLPHSLERLCKDFELESDVAKLNLDKYMYDNGYIDKDHFFATVPENDKFLINYLENDCKSLYIILQEVIKLSALPFHDFLKCPTVASLALRVYRTQFKEDYKVATSTKTYNAQVNNGKYVETMIRCGYYGGRVEIYKPFAEKALHYDVTSLYPHVMKKMKYPVGEPTIYGRMDKIKPKTVYKQFKRTHVGAGFASAHVNVPEGMYLPPLPYKTLGKTFFPTGKLYGVWTFHELELAEEMGCVIEELEEVYYFKKTAPIFVNYVEHFEQMKNESVGSKRAFAKLMSNALSGKFGAKREIQTMSGIDKKETFDKKGVKYIECKYTQFKGLDQRYLLSTEELMSGYIQPHLSAYITSYARIFLYRQLKEQHEKGDLFYCDTDAIVCEAPMKKYKVHQNEYGKWKLEGYIDRGVYPQPKFYGEQGRFWNEKTQTYEEGEVIKAKGVPTEEIRNMCYADIEKMCIQLMNGDRDIKLSSHSDRISMGRVLKANMKIDALSISEKVMQLRTVQKRVVNYQLNESMPHHFMNYGDNYPVVYEPNEIHEKMMDLYHDVDDDSLYENLEVAN